jgi:hypothetical protein
MQRPPNMYIYFFAVLSFVILGSTDANAAGKRPVFTGPEIVNLFIGACQKKLGKPTSNLAALKAQGFTPDPKPGRGKPKDNLVHNTHKANALVVDLDFVYSCEVSGTLARPKSVKRRDAKTYFLLQTLSTFAEVRKKIAPNAKIIAKKGSGVLRFKHRGYSYEVSMKNMPRLRVLVAKSK